VVVVAMTREEALECVEFWRRWHERRCRAPVVVTGGGYCKRFVMVRCKGCGSVAFVHFD